jgi:hypothetical protein
MDRQGVEQVVKSVLIEYALPFTLVAITSGGGVWSVELAGTPSSHVTLTIHDGTGMSVRRAVMRALDVEEG